jgi:hypothetical protein
MFFSTRVTGIALIGDIGIDPKAMMESGFTFPPRRCLVRSSVCHPIFAMSLQDIGTSLMEMSENTGRNGRRINTGKNMEEGDGMERRGGNMTGRVPTKGEAKESTAINPISANANEGSGEIVPSNDFPGGGFQEIFSLFPSTKAFRVERILLTFNR